MKGAGRIAGMLRVRMLAGLVAGFLLAPDIVRSEELQVAEEDFGGTFARVRYLEDGLTIRRAQRGEQVEAGLNSPITPGDVVLADSGRAEIVLADGSVVWLEDGSRVEFTSLADVEGRYEKTTLLGLQEGIVRIEAVDSSTQNRTFRIDGTAGTVYLVSGGSYRLESDGHTLEIAVFRGSAELSGDGGSTLVDSGYTSRVVPGRAAEEPERFNTRRLDDFDEFCADRLEGYVRNEEVPEEVEEELPQEVQPYASELSYYGAWHNVPVYGWVWRPVYYGSWAPYWNGYWSWCSTGWVWVSYDAWGWAPYRYGRWDHMVDIGWVWIPGGVWRGAWVSFAVGTGYVGWCPLNYWNRSVFYAGYPGHPVHVNPHHLDGRGWRFVSTGQFSARDLARHALRPDRVPGDAKVTVTGRLPQFSPRDVGARPESGRAFAEKVRAARVDLPGGRSEHPVPFRNQERTIERTRPRGVAQVPSRAQPTAPVRPRREAVRPSPGPARPPAARSQAPTREVAPRPQGQSREATPRPQSEMRDTTPRPQRLKIRPPSTARPRTQAAPRLERPESRGPAATTPPGMRRLGSPGRPKAGTAPTTADRVRPPSSSAGQPPPQVQRDRRTTGRYVDQLFEGARRQRVRPPTQGQPSGAGKPPEVRGQEGQKGRPSGESRGQSSSRGAKPPRGDKQKDRPSPR